MYYDICRYSNGNCFILKTLRQPLFKNSEVVVWNDCVQGQLQLYLFLFCTYLQVF